MSLPRYDLYLTNRAGQPSCTCGHEADDHQGISLHHADACTVRGCGCPEYQPEYDEESSDAAWDEAHE